jgi:hypothetical protein
MALAAGMGEEGFVKAAAGAAERSEQSGEPLQVPTGYAKKPSEAGARNERRNLGTLLHGFQGGALRGRNGTR